MVKFAPNICYSAVDQETAVLKCERAVSGPFALLGRPGTLNPKPHDLTLLEGDVFLFMTSLWEKLFYNFFHTSSLHAVVHA